MELVTCADQEAFAKGRLYPLACLNSNGGRSRSRSRSRRGRGRGRFRCRCGFRGRRRRRWCGCWCRDNCWCRCRGRYCLDYGLRGGNNERLGRHALPARVQKRQRCGAEGLDNMVCKHANGPDIHLADHAGRQCSRTEGWQCDGNTALRVQGEQELGLQSCDRCCGELLLERVHRGDDICIVERGHFDQSNRN
jgi:hypothetical protein